MYVSLRYWAKSSNITFKRWGRITRKVRIFVLHVAVSSTHLWNVREEMACDEAELGADEFAERMHSQEKLQEQVISVQI